MLSKLLKRLPKKYYDRVAGFDAEDDLIDDCKYILYISEKYNDSQYYPSYPVRSVNEAVNIIKEL